MMKIGFLRFFSIWDFLRIACVLDKFFLMWVFIFVGIQLENMLLYCGNLSLVILIRRRSFGQGFLLKGRTKLRLINRLISGGKITVPWCLGN